MKPNTSSHSTEIAKGVYLIHFATKLAHAGHYLGYADNIEQRIEAHKKGRGARLTEVIREQGIEFDCVRTWEGQSRSFERQLKNRKNAARLCPICNPDGWQRNGQVE